MADGLSGLAGSIRSATDAETFDLAGKNASTVQDAIERAFETPFVLTQTIRLTFVTGAGKLARQKYDEHAAKAVTGPLKELGYEDDAGGGPGTYKLQHDTGKNLKTVVVYPKVTGGSGANEEDLGHLNKLSLASDGLIPDGTPEHKIAFSPIATTFERMVESMCPSWSQKKGCIKAIEDLAATIQRLDRKLMTGTPLSDVEQDFYDSVSVQSLANKLSKVKELMHKQVKKGELTASEKAFLLKQVKDRLEILRTELSQTEKAKKSKRAEVLKQNLEKAQERQDMLSKISPTQGHALKHNAQIAKLRKELAPLVQMEATTKGRLLSLKESQSMTRKEKIETEISELENASRGWFETDEDFNLRVQASRISTKATTVPTKKTMAKPPGPSGSRTTTWVTPGASAWGTKKKTGPKPPNAKAKAGSGKGGGVFAAMMMDSDSD